MTYSPSAALQNAPAASPRACGVRPVLSAALWHGLAVRDTLPACARGSPSGKLGFWRCTQSGCLDDHVAAAQVRSLAKGSVFPSVLSCCAY